MQYLTDNDLAGERGCILSDCGTYRYRLWREWDHRRPTLAFLTLNPSTADHMTDDPTIARCRARASAGKFGRLDVVNLFPLRATDPGELLTHSNPLRPTRGPISADGAIVDALERAHTIICAWGAHPAAPARADDVMRLLSLIGARNRLYHLGLNKDGSPKHPLHRRQHAARTLCIQRVNSWTSRKESASALPRQLRYSACRGMRLAA